MIESVWLGRIDERYKKKVKRSMPAFGLGWLDFIDHIFFHMPFTGPVQANLVRTNYSIKKAVWDQHHETMSADHRLPGARVELHFSWKAYVTIRAHGLPVGFAWSRESIIKISQLEKKPLETT